MNGQFLVPILILAGLVVMGVVLAAVFSGRGAVEHPYAACDALLTPAERSFFGVLRQASDPSHLLFAKVRLADVVRVQRGVAGSRRTAAFNRISAKHVDFVVCEAGTSRVLAVIELDDKSHREEARRRRDEFLDATLAAAGIPVLHVPAQSGYALPELQRQLRALLSAAPLPKPNLPLA